MSQRFSQGRWNLGRRTFLKLSGAALANASEIADASVPVPRTLTLGLLRVSQRQNCCSFLGKPEHSIVLKQRQAIADALKYPHEKR